MLRTAPSCLIALTLAVLTPQANADPIVILSSPDNLSQLTVGDTARIDVTLQGLSTGNEFIFILNTEVLFPSSLFQPVPDPNNSSGLTPGPILSPTSPPPPNVPQADRFNELSSLTAVAATGNFQDFP